MSSSGATPIFGLPYPLLTGDGANGAEQIQLLAEACENVLVAIQEQAASATQPIAVGREPVPATAQDIAINCGFRPQKVTVYTQRTHDLAEGGVAPFSVGQAGLTPSGDISQWVIATHADSGAFARRTYLDSIGGYIFGSTTIIARAKLSAFTDSGFVLQVLGGVGGDPDSVEYFWEAWA